MATAEPERVVPICARLGPHQSEVATDRDGRGVGRAARNEYGLLTVRLRRSSSSRKTAPEQAIWHVTKCDLRRIAPERRRSPTSRKARLRRRFRTGRSARARARRLPEPKLIRSQEAHPQGSRTSARYRA